MPDRSRTRLPVFYRIRRPATQTPSPVALRMLAPPGARAHPLSSPGVEMTHRPAARILCLDAGQRLLLMRWRDPHDGTLLWEPPGGGVEPGETPLDAARRELAEETGLDPAAVLDRSVPVPRDFRWNGRHYTGSEDFFLARFPGARPPLSRTGLLPDEQVSLHAHAWIPWADLGSLPGPVEPPRLTGVLRALAPDGPWATTPPLGHGVS